MKPRGVVCADMLVHEAAHAVIAWELGIPIVHLRFSPKDWSGEMPFKGGMHEYAGHLPSERAREVAEKDLLIYHAGMVAQRLFHYESARSYAGSIDAAGIMRVARMVEQDADLIDEWSEYIEERVRVMLYDPTTWARVVALAPEIARRLYLPGEEIAAFLRIVDVTGADSPRHLPWNRERYAFGRGLDALGLSRRIQGRLAIAEITTVAELLTYSAWDLKGSLWRVGAKTVSEIEKAVQALGLALAEGYRRDKEARVQRARLELP